MGKLRLVSKNTEPGFLSFQVEPPTVAAAEKSHIQLQTRQGTRIEIAKDMPLRQVAKLVKLLEFGRGHGLG